MKLLVTSAVISVILVLASAPIWAFYLAAAAIGVLYVSITGAHHLHGRPTMGSISKALHSRSRRHREYESDETQAGEHSTAEHVATHM
ncbi:MAG TPA: hypothetical protein VID70_04825 [Solirubrobacteraceae bacterium]